MRLATVPAPLRLLSAAVVAVTLLFGAPAAHAAKVSATISLSEQTMTVTVGGQVAYVWPVSTGRKGYRTPTGSWKPTRMYKEYYSRKYDMSPMPHSVFFTGGYAVHGTGYVRNLGRPASHGCVRLAPANARAFYNLVREHGRSATRIRIVR